MEKIELVFVPAPAIGHLISTVKAAELLLDRHSHLSITLLIMKLSNFGSILDDFIQSFAASTTLSNRIRFIDLPRYELDSDFYSFIDRHKPDIKQAVSKITQSESTSDSPRLAGFVLDMLCTSMIDVANEFGVPSYIFFASNATFLGFMLHFQVIHDEKKISPIELKDSGAELTVPCLANSFPAKVMPFILLREKWFYPFVDHIRRFKETKGIIVNTFVELESYAIKSFFDAEIPIPPVYPIGPILDVKSDEINSKIKQWLDNQPLASVVFLCFGSMGSFSEDQVKEIAYALEHSGYRFLWSIRRPPPTDKIEIPIDYADSLAVLPNGFLDRMAEIGKVVGWAPQATILAHPAIGGFISHCGWNSILESIWYNVPIAMWPLYSEQQFNAFLMVIELGLAIEIKMDYMIESEMIVNSDEIERQIRCLMEQDSEQRKKMKGMSEMSRKALMDDGSSSISLDRFIKNVIDNRT